MNQDYHDILSALVGRNARFIIVGAHALAAHGYPRATVDIDHLTEALLDLRAERVGPAQRIRLDAKMIS